MDSQLKKGVLEMCLLHLISKNDIYGYELIKIITKVFPDVLNSTIYTKIRFGDLAVGKRLFVLGFEFVRKLLSPVLGINIFGLDINADMFLQFGYIFLPGIYFIYPTLGFTVIILGACAALLNF